MERVGVHRHQREPGVVEIGDGAAGPMLESLAGGEILEVAVHANAMPVRSGIIQDAARRLQLIVLASSGRWRGSRNCSSQIAARLPFGSSVVLACSGSKPSPSIRPRMRKRACRRG